MVVRTLIATADERTWPKNDDEPILFLGEWCKLFSRKERWSVLDSCTVSYHWDDRKKLLNDSNYLHNLTELLLGDLSVKLNEMHGVNYSDRYWRILVGYWLLSFVGVLFDRWIMLNKAISEYEIKSCRVLTPCCPPPKDIYEFNQQITGDIYNETIYGQLLKGFLSDKIFIEEVTVEELTAKSIKVEHDGFSLRKLLVSSLKKTNRWFSRDNEFFFISTYLYLPVDLKLQVRLKQFPRVWGDVDAPNVTVNKEMRQWSLGEESLDDFYNVVRRMVPLHIPTIYLEGYNSLQESISYLPWPRQPKVIFTSSSHFSNDVFKAWAAEKTELGTPLVIGQHGGNYGMTPFCSYEKHEITIADKWFSWGWNNKKVRNIEAIGNLPALGRQVSHNPKGKALMVSAAFSRYSNHIMCVPIAGQCLSYFDDQYLFVNTLTEDFRKQLIVRLYKNDYGWSQSERWQNSISDVQYDSGQSSMRKLMETSRLYISTYNATTYLESISCNIPTIIFWNPEFFELNEDAKYYIGELASVGIFHDTPEGAAQHMMKIWDNIEEWWARDDVQTVRQNFCQYYSKVGKQPFEKLELILTDGLNSCDGS